MVRKLSVPLVLLVCTVSLLAQNQPAGSNAPSPRLGRQGGVPPCLQKAGVDKSVMEQLFSVQRDMRSQVEGVCSNTSLSLDQKRQQVQEIHQQAHQKIEGLITPEQEKEIIACRQEMHGGNHPGGGGDLLGGGGCGGGMHAGARPGYNGQRPGNGTTSPSPVSQSAPQN
jgi:hypothetical protein